MMATSNSLASVLVDKPTTEDTPLRQRRIACKSIRRVTFGCRPGSRIGIGGDSGSAPDNGGWTSDRRASDQVNWPPVNLTAGELPVQPVYRIHGVIPAPERKLYSLSGDTTCGCIHNPAVAMETTRDENIEAGNQQTQIIEHLLRRYRNNDGKVMTANTQQEQETATRVGPRPAMEGPVRTSTVVNTVQVYGEGYGRCLKPLLKPIQDVVRTSLLDYSLSHLPADAHQHITNEVIITMENDQLNVTVNVNCTMFAGDTSYDDEQSASADKDITGAAEQVEAAMTSVQYSG